MPAERDHPGNWLLPIGGVFAISALLLFVTFAIDHGLTNSIQAFMRTFLASDANTLRYTLTTVAQSLAATLGLMTAIVLVITQLSANRYTPKIIDSFTHNATNLVVFSLFIISIVFSLWVAHTIRDGFVPQVGALLSMLLMSTCFALVIPYSVHVFRVLNPRTIVAQLRNEAIRAIRKAHRKPARDQEMRKSVVRRLEQIADIAMSCIQNVDEEVARYSILAMQSLLTTYMKEKEAFNHDWHAIEEDQMIGSPRRLAEEIIKRQAWVEFRALRLLRILYRHSSGRLPEINSLIAQALRSCGTVAADKGDLSVLEIVVMFFNSLVRSAVALKDGRACGDTLYQYRLLAEKVLEVQPALAERIVTYFTYYGTMLLEVEIRQTFDLVCYDLRKINEKALKIHGRGPQKTGTETPDCTRILAKFLAYHDRLDHRKYPMQSRALVKHYINLASYYLHRGEERFARAIFEKIWHTPLQTIRELQHEIASVTDPLFWEISDRVINFNFIIPEQKVQLAEFVSWFETEPETQGMPPPEIPEIL